MIEDLADDLATLVSAERAARPSPQMHSRVRAKLAASAVVVGAATVSSSSAAAAGKTVAAGTGFATKVIIVVALVVGGTTAAVVVTREKSSPKAPSPSTPTMSTPRVPSVSTTNAPTPGEVPEPPLPAAAPPLTGSATPTQLALPPAASPASRDHVRSVEHTPVAASRAPSKPPAPAAKSEAETVAHAWRTLATDPTAALVEIETITGDTLVEEREAIRCVALARLHRPEAADAITKFLSEHPQSVHRALVERAQEGLP